MLWIAIVWLVGVRLLPKPNSSFVTSFHASFGICLLVVVPMFHDSWRRMNVPIEQCVRVGAYLTLIYVGALVALAGVL